MNRKLLIVLMTVIATVALVATAFAGHMVKEGFEYVPEIVKSKKASINLSGQFRVRGEINSNLGDFLDDDPVTNPSGDADDTTSSNNERVRLKLDVTVSPNTMGVLELETRADSSSSYTWGSACTGSTLGTYGFLATGSQGNCKPDDMHVRQGYIAHQGSGLLGMMAGFKAGHQLIGIGNRLFYDHTEYGDDALVFWMEPMDATELSLTVAKLDENTGAGDDDITLVSFAGTTSLDGINLGANVSLLSDNSIPSMHSDLWNIGLLGDMEISGININADVEFQFGSIDNGAIIDDVDFGGWALHVGADTKVGDFSVGAEFAYGSGDDDPLDTDADMFMNSLSTGQKYTYVYEHKACTAAANLAPGTCVTNTGLANTWYINVGASTNLTPDIKGAFDLYYLSAVEEPIGIEDDKDIGIEVNAKLTYQLDNNIVLYLENGMLFAGDYYKSLTPLGEDPDDPYSSRLGLLLNF